MSDGSELTYSLLSKHPAIAVYSDFLPSVTLNFYGRNIILPKVGSDTFTVEFSDVHFDLALVEMQLRCGGWKLTVQIAEPHILIDFGSSLDSNVPELIQRSAVLHALNPILMVLEQYLKLSIELIGMRIQTAVSAARNSLGCIVTKSGQKDSKSTKLLLQFEKIDAWKQLAITQLNQRKTTDMDGFLIKLSLITHPIFLKMDELKRLEPGDILITDASADPSASILVRFMLGKQILNGLTAFFRGNESIINNISTNTRFKPSSKEDNLLMLSMPDSVKSSAPNDLANYPGTETSTFVPLSLDSIEVDIEVELARVTLPLSSLRNLAVGQVLETQSFVDGRTVILSCGGQRFGFGQLVSVGERLGVRIVTLERFLSGGMSIESVGASRTDSNTSNA